MYKAGACRDLTKLHGTRVQVVLVLDELNGSYSQEVHIVLQWVDGWVANPLLKMALAGTLTLLLLCQGAALKIK